jgi:hypothetical protein
LPIADLPFEEAALAEPLACVMHGLNRLTIPPKGEVLAGILEAAKTLVELHDASSTDIYRPTITLCWTKSFQLSGRKYAHPCAESNCRHPAKVELASSRPEKPHRAFDPVRSGGSQDDLRLVANAFTEKTGLAVVVKTDPEWIPGLHGGDHAGRYEISQLMDIRPDLVDLSLLDRQFESNSGGRLAVGEDAAQSSAAYGHTLNEAIIAAIGETAFELVKADEQIVSIDSLSYEAMERIWQGLYATISDWSSVNPRANQVTVPANSRWHAYVHVASTLAARGSANTV